MRESHLGMYTLFSMPNTKGPDCLLLCNGKGCAKKQKKAYKKLEKRFEKQGLVAIDVACQGSCVGPTVVLVDDDGPRWFEDLRSEKAQRDVVESAVRVVAGKKAKPSKRLRSRELTGKQRTRAAKRLKKAA